MRALVLSSLLVATAPPDAAESAEPAPEVPFPTIGAQDEPPAEAPSETSDATAPPEAPSEGDPSDATEPAEPPPTDPVPRSQPEVPTYTAIPSYREVEPMPAPAVPRTTGELPPPTGRGRQAVGGILVGGGVTLIGVSAAMIAIDEDIAVWIPGMVLGTAATLAGAASLVGGKKRRDRYEAWVADQGGDAPPQGVGMIAGGLTCIGAGTLGMIFGGFSLALQDGGDLPYGQVLLPLGATSLVTGLGLVIAGSARNKRFARWNSARTPTPTVALLPGRGRELGGASVGLMGRF